MEIRFKADALQQRPVGFFGPDENSEFAILFWTIEKGDRFVDKDVCKTCKSRIDEVKAGAARVEEIDIWLP